MRTEPAAAPTEVEGRVHREGGGDRAHQVDEQGEDEQLLAAEAVCELPEEQGADTCPRHADGPGETDVAAVQPKPGIGVAQRVAQRVDDGDLEPVQDSHGAQAHHHQLVPAGPG